MPEPKVFDPLAYIESAFLDNNPGGAAKDEKSAAVAVPTKSSDRSVKFRKTALSAPRPRRSKDPVHEAPMEANFKELLEHLPKNIAFLGKFFDDSVTAHYYNHGFKETREQLMRRLLDPELTLEEVSRLLGVCPATIRRYTNRNWLEHHRTPGGQRRFRLSSLVKFVDKHGRTPEA